MLTSVNQDLASCQKQPSPEHAVWGDIRRPTAASIFRLGARLAALALFVACGLAMAGSKISNDLEKMLGGNGNIEVIVQFSHIPTTTDLKPFSTKQIIRTFRHVGQRRHVREMRTRSGSDGRRREGKIVR